MVRTISRCAAAVFLAATMAATAQNELPGDGPRAMTRERFQTRVQALREAQDRLLAGQNEEFAGLLEDDRPSFAELQRRAQLRRELLAASPEAQALTQQMEQLRAEYMVANPEEGLAARRRSRPELTDEQKEAVQEHRAEISGLHEQLDATLSQASERYAELAAIEEPTPEQRREMMTLRRELIGESDAAQELVEQIQSTIAAFREENGELVRPLPPRARLLRHGAQAVRTLQETIDEMLAEQSEEYAALLALEERTGEQQQQMLELREQLLAENEAAAQLARTAKVLRHRLRSRIREIRDRHDRPAPRPIPPVADGGSTTDDAGE